jgi:hypothetical protein
MQIEWSEDEVLKLAESARKRRRGGRKHRGLGPMVENGVKEGAK